MRSLAVDDVAVRRPFARARQSDQKLLVLTITEPLVIPADSSKVRPAKQMHAGRPGKAASRMQERWIERALVQWRKDHLGVVRRPVGEADVSAADKCVVARQTAQHVD